MDALLPLFPPKPKDYRWGSKQTALHWPPHPRLAAKFNRFQKYTDECRLIIGLYITPPPQASPHPGKEPATASPACRQHVVLPTSEKALPSTRRDLLPPPPEPCVEVHRRSFSWCQTSSEPAQQCPLCPSPTHAVFHLPHHAPRILELALHGTPGQPGRFPIQVPLEATASTENMHNIFAAHYKAFSAKYGQLRGPMSLRRRSASLKRRKCCHYFCRVPGVKGTPPARFGGLEVADQKPQNFTVRFNRN